MYLEYLVLVLKVESNMKKYYIKTIFSGWVDVPKENYERYKSHIIEHSNPPSCTPRELAERLTKIVEE